MRSIEYSNSFKKDYKRIKATPRHRKDIDDLLGGVLDLLVIDEALPLNKKDHYLVGNWSGYRECHIKPDLLLIYKQPEDPILRLARLGSHSELFR
jgi:mRNA interferase YafQ